MDYAPRFINLHGRDANGTSLWEKHMYRRHRSYPSIAKIEEGFKDGTNKGQPAGGCKGVGPIVIIVIICGFLRLITGAVKGTRLGQACVCRAASANTTGPPVIGGRPAATPWPARGRKKPGAGRLLWSFEA